MMMDEVEDDYLMSSDDNDNDEDDYYQFDDEDQPHIKQSSFKVITKESLLVAQREVCQRIMDLLTLSEKHARTLLIHHRWDVDKLISVLVEKGQDRLLMEAGITLVEHKHLASLHSSSPVMACNICMEDVLSHEVTAMDCGHYFCNNSDGLSSGLQIREFESMVWDLNKHTVKQAAGGWMEHFKIKINEGQSRRIRCMMHKCNTICDEVIIRNLVCVRDSKLVEQFDRFLLESYIEDNKMVKWCPSVPHCGNAICIEGDVCCEVECSCGQQFCFSCLSNVHSPCSCLMWKLWRKKCEDESETGNWITSNTKPCPSCQKAVEKNGGCNIVSCICQKTFCWVCRIVTKGHAHSCGRYTEQTDRKVELAKRYLLRYLHYYNRYKAHQDSRRLEMGRLAAMQDEMSKSKYKDANPMKFSLFILNGLVRLVRSRQVLSYSYPFAFYMFWEELFMDKMSASEKRLKQNLFEDQQQQFEAIVERLAKLLEVSTGSHSGKESQKKELELNQALVAPVSDSFEDKVIDARQQIANMSSITDRLCKSMYECIEELLGSLQVVNHNIAPYRSAGVEKALELPGLM